MPKVPVHLVTTAPSQSQYNIISQVAECMGNTTNVTLHTFTFGGT